MAWAVAVDDTFTRSDTSVGAAGSTTDVGNGWIDVHGGVWSISGDVLLGSTSDTSGYQYAALTRPSGENAVTQRAVAITSSLPTAATGVVLRAQSVGVYYLLTLEPSTNQANIYTINGATVSKISGGTINPALTASHNYTIDASATGASPTALSLIITDTTTGSVVASYSVSDATAGLQPAGAAGVIAWAGANAAQAATFSRVTTYVTASAGTITLSPTSVTTGTAGQTITVTGSGAALTGATFTLAGGLGAAIAAQSVSSATSATLTINPGVPGYGAATITSSAGGSAALAINPPALGALNIGFIGDSITAGTNGNPVAAMVAFLSTKGYAAVATNKGVSGTSTTDWLPGGSYLPAAISAFQSAGVTVVQVMLGTNDWRTPNSLTAAQHSANMRAIVAALRTAGFLVMINKAPWMLPNENAGNGQVWPDDANFRTLTGWKANVSLCDGVTVAVGDTGFHQYTSLNNLSVLDSYGIHPKDAANNNLLGQYWALAFLGRYGAASSVPNRWTHS